MGRFRKKPIEVEATQWFKNGDHPEDRCDLHAYAAGEIVTKSEGKVVRYHRDPDVPDDELCSTCGRLAIDHGWIDTLEGAHIVCPGDWIITGIKGEHYPCKPDVFAATYEPVEP